MNNKRFQLKYLSDYTIESIIAEIIRVDKIVNKQILTKKDFEKYSRISPTTVTKRFDGWKQALSAAGLGYKYSGKTITEKQKKQTSKKMSDEDIIKEIRNVAERKGKNTITVQDIRDYSSSIGPYVLKSRFGSVKKAIERAGLEISNHAKRYTEVECFENFLNVWTHYGRQPKFGEMKCSPSEVGPKAYIVRWGSWIKALEAFVAFIDKESKNELIDSKQIEKVRKKPKQKMNKPEDKREISLSLRYKVLVKYNFTCAKCGKSPAKDFGVELQVDHIHPFSKGGKTTLNNLQVLCKDCNLGKGDVIFTESQHD
jgi:hypothetical protein